MLAAALSAEAADYPARPIKLVVPYVAGGPTDVFGRLLAEYLARDLKQAVVVENKGGAQGAIGAEAVARAEPDGYALLATSGSVIAVNPFLYKKLSYDPARDFRALALVTTVPMVLCVNPQLPATTVAELVAYAKQNPGKLNFGSSGSGSFSHLAAEMFEQMAGIEMTHVAYKGAHPALTDVMSGHIQLMFESASQALPLIRSGALRGIGVGSAERNPDLSDVPTIAESGYPDYLISVWNGVFAPAALPDDVAREAHRQPQPRARRRPISCIAGRSSAMVCFARKARIRSRRSSNAERARWSALIKSRNISSE